MTIIIARFIPVIRTFAPVIGGIAKMNYNKFLFYNIAGGILWATSLPLLGYYLGARIQNPDRFLMPVVVVVLVLSFLPFFIKFVQYMWTKRRP
jgi:membrane-associated protein